MAEDRSSLVRKVAWVLVFVAPAAAAASWFTPHPDLDRDDAVDVAVGSLADVDVTAEVTAEVTDAVHETEEGVSIDVWVVPADVGDQRIELRVHRSVGELVYIDDRIGPDQTERLLTDAQVESMDDYRDDATRGRWIARNAAATVAAAIIAAVAWLMVTRAQRLHAAS